jgi:hypothetical protein
MEKTPLIRQKLETGALLSAGFEGNHPLQDGKLYSRLGPVIHASAWGEALRPKIDCHFKGVI